MLKREEEILEKVCKIPSQKIEELIDFIDFLEKAIAKRG